MLRAGGICWRSRAFLGVAHSRAFSRILGRPRKSLGGARGSSEGRFSRMRRARACETRLRIAAAPDSRRRCGWRGYTGMIDVRNGEGGGS